MKVGLIYSSEEYSAAELIKRMPVDVIIVFSSEEGIEYYGQMPFTRGVPLSAPYQATIMSGLSFWNGKKDRSGPDSVGKRYQGYQGRRYYLGA